MSSDRGPHGETKWRPADQHPFVPAFEIVGVTMPDLGGRPGADRKDAEAPRTVLPD